MNFNDNEMKVKFKVVFVNSFFYDVIIGYENVGPHSSALIPAFFI